jgi:hypothetical protein
MNNSANDDFEMPDDAVHFKVTTEIDAQHVAGSRRMEEEQARTRLAGLVSPKLYDVLMSSLDPNNRIAMQFTSRNESAKLYRTIADIRKADRAAAGLENSKEAARRNALTVHVALVDPATLNGVRARIVRDAQLTPSDLILLPRNTASPEDVAAGIAAMSQIRRIYGDGDMERIDVDVLDFRGTLSTVQTEHARQILKSAMTGPSHSLSGFGDASMTSVQLSPLKP